MKKSSDAWISLSVKEGELTRKAEMPVGNEKVDALKNILWEQKFRGQWYLSESGNNVTAHKIQWEAFHGEYQRKQYKR